MPEVERKRVTSRCALPTREAERTKKGGDTESNKEKEGGKVAEANGAK